MQVFVIDPDPFVCAKSLDDKRLNKMIIETAQIMSTIRFNMGLNYLYKPTHFHHPIVKWANNISNYEWLQLYFIKLSDEYFYRFNKNHMSSIKMSPFLYHKQIDYFNINFCNCTPYQGNVFDSYKKLLSNKWENDKRPPKFTSRPIPDFFYLK